MTFYVRTITREERGMEIRLASLLQGAQEAEGTTIIIDVFRAFTTAAVAFDRGAEQIVLVAEVEEALDLRRRGVGHLCIGEVDGKRPAGFDFGNSPYEVSHADFTGKTLIQSTRAGTVGVNAATAAATIYLGSLVIATATVNAVLATAPPLVSIVAMGSAAAWRSDEDEQCALFLRNLLQGRRPDHEAVQKLVLIGQEAQKYGDPSQPHFHPRDREMALHIDRYPFAIRVQREDDLLVARPHRPH
jgi:2-phosphosulfolactate phosphatase